MSICEPSTLDLEYLKTVLSYDPETGEFRWLIARNSHAGQVLPGTLAGWPQGNRIKICVDQRDYMAHRLAWFYMQGEWPNKSIDHIDGNGLNNRFANLRMAEHKENMQNIRKPHKDSRSGLLGVSWHRRKQLWHARIHTDGKTTHIGYFLDPEIAHEAYLKAKRLLHPFQTIT